MEVESFFAASSNIPSIPKLAQELIQSINDDDIDTRQFADKIALDQSLSIKLLGMANSVYYGVSRDISSVNDAIVTIGFDAIRNLVMASCMSKTFPNIDGLNIKAFWRSSFRTATVAKQLAKTAKLDGETAFTCGILHNVGELLIHMQLPIQAMEVMQGVKLGEDRIELELEIIGITYAELGAALAEHWQFPELICQAILGQARPMQNEAHSKYAAILYLANYFIQNHSLHKDDLLERFPEGLAEALDLDCQKLFDEMDITDLGNPFEIML
ncbi:MAG: HDOD domain-containing protein [Pseudomonadales bacterium]|nr:HDOD domain-containing protein [Pseudomonadales bacterium]